MYVNVTRVLEPGLGRKSCSAEDLQKKKEKKKNIQESSKVEIASLFFLSLSLEFSNDAKKKKGKEKKKKIVSWNALRNSRYEVSRVIPCEMFLNEKGNIDLTRIILELNFHRARGEDLLA